MTNSIIGDRFELLEALGSGGVSEVYRARDILNGRDIALKILHPHLLEMTANLRHEIEITRAIKHPNVAAYYDLFESNEHVCLSLEYLPGGDLKRFILEHGRLAVPEAVRCACEALSGLAAAHRAGIIHCDVKPHNILLDGEGHVRITDFGLARMSTRKRLADKSHAGTPDYVAPEITAGGYFDARSDLYSMGVTLFEMLTGELPYQSNTVQETLWKHAHADIPSARSLCPEVPEALDAIVAKAMAKDPSDRFQTALEFKEAIESMKVPAPVPRPPSHSCRVCGAAVLDAFPICLSCGTTEIALATAAAGEPKYRVAVTGPGKPGDRLNPDLRHAILRLLESAGATSPALERRIPRLPFVLLGDLTRDSAREVKRALELLGLSAEAAGQEEPAGTRAIRRLLNRKTLALYPRVVLIGVGTMGWGWSNIGRLVGHAGAAAPWILAALGALLFVGVPAVIRVSSAIVRAKQDAARRIPSTAVLVPVAQRIDEPEVRGLIAHIAGQLHTIETELDRDPNVAAEMKEELRAAVRAVMGPVQDLVAQIAGLESSQRNLDEAGTYVRTDTDALSVRRKTESTIQLYTDRLLNLSVKLDRISVGLAAIGTQRAKQIVSELAVEAGELVIEASSQEEMDHATGVRGATE